MLSDQPEIARELGVPSEPLELGPKLSTRSYRRLAVTWPRELRDACARASRRSGPTTSSSSTTRRSSSSPRCSPLRCDRFCSGPNGAPCRSRCAEGLPRRAYLAAARRASAVMAVSAGTRASVCDVGVPGGKVVVVPNAVSPDEIEFRPGGRERIRAELGIPHEAFVVGCVSRLHPKKRNDVVVDAVEHARRADAFDMAGNGETEAALRKQAEGLGDRAHFIPTPGRDTIAEVLSAFDLSVFCPSPTEGAPRAVILAHAGRATVPRDRSRGGRRHDRFDDRWDQRSRGRRPGPRRIDPALLADPGTGTRQGRRARRLAIERYSPEAVSGRIENLVQRTDRPV